MIMNLKKKKIKSENNGVKNQLQFRKNFADKYAELRMIRDQEKDPIRKEKMSSRLALGILDFSDL